MTIVNVALPSTKAGLHLSAASQQWVVDGYLVTFGGFLLLAARARSETSRRETRIPACSRLRVRTSVWNCRFSGLFIGTYSAVPYAVAPSVPEGHYDIRTPGVRLVAAVSSLPPVGLRQGVTLRRAWRERGGSLARSLGRGAARPR